jgi:quercetin dioxygenase-like cupin family protein
MERINTYENWLKEEGLPVIKGYSVFDLMKVPVHPWARKGGFGARFDLVGSEGTVDVYLCEIPPGGSLLPQKHLYEEVIYILSGYGATTVWVEGSEKQSFEWQAGSLFSPPLNTWHQHFNGQSDKPVRYFGVTRAPVYMNLFHDLDFIFHNDYVFKSRYDGGEGYFSSRGKAHPGRIWESNFIPDCRGLKLQEWQERGGGGANVCFELSNNVQQSAHVSEFPVGMYKKAHRHGPGSEIVVLSGQGYTLMWPEGGERVKVDWQENSLFVPPDWWFHQHFNTGKEPARYLAIHAERSFKYVGLGKFYEADQNIKAGGIQVDYEDEDPEIRRLFKEELARNGAPWRMSQYFPGE